MLKGGIPHRPKRVAPAHVRVDVPVRVFAVSFFSCCRFLPDVLQLILGLDLKILLEKKIEIVKDPGQQFAKIFCLPQLSQRI